MRSPALLRLVRAAVAAAALAPTACDRLGTAPATHGSGASTAGTAGTATTGGGTSTGGGLPGAPVGPPTMALAMPLLRAPDGSLFEPLLLELSTTPLCDGHTVGPEGVTVLDVSLARVVASATATGGFGLAEPVAGTYAVVATLPAAGPAGQYALVQQTTYGDPSACGGAWCNVLGATTMASGTLQISTLTTTGSGHIEGTLSGLTASDDAAPGGAAAPGDPNVPAAPIAPPPATPQTFAADGCTANLGPAAPTQPVTVGDPGGTTGAPAGATTGTTPGATTGADATMTGGSTGAQTM